MLGFLLFAAVEPRMLPWQPRRAVAAGLVTLFAVRMAVVAEAWAEHRRDLADLRAVIAAVPPGAAGIHDQRATGGGAGLLGRAGRAAGGSRTRCAPIIICPRCCSSSAARSGRCCSPIPHSSRSACGPPMPGWPGRRTTSPRTPPSRLTRNADRPALRDFDFVLMLEAGADPDLPGFVPKCLALVSSTDFAALFRVRRDPAACVGGQTLGLDETPASE